MRTIAAGPAPLLRATVLRMFQCFQRLIHDPDEFTHAVSGVTLTVEPHQAMERAASIRQYQSPTWALDFNTTHVKARVLGEAPRGWATFALIRQGSVSRWQGVACGPGVLLCNPPGVGLDGIVSPGFSWTSVSVPVSVWSEAGRIAGVQGKGPEHFGAWPLPAPLLTRLERRISHVQQLLGRADTDPACSPQASREAADLARSVAVLAWQMSAPPAVPAPSRSSPIHRARLARRAEAWMRTHLHEPSSIPDVCLALNVSRRELEYAFTASFDTSPRRFLQTLRLNSIRRHLQRADALETSVTEVAMTHGVNHLGRFAEEYRLLFGEKPSRTLLG